MRLSSSSVAAAAMLLHAMLALVVLLSLQVGSAAGSEDLIYDFGYVRSLLVVGIADHSSLLLFCCLAF